MILDPKKLEEHQIYNLMMSSILPRPIAWISTVDKKGRTNLAPFAYFMGICCIPMTVMFCPVVGPRPRFKKDTLLNIEQVPQFVVNVSTAHNIEAVNRSASPLPHGESEFDFAGVTPVPSSLVIPPRVKEASVAFECVVRDIIEISDQPGGGWVVLGTVVAVHVDDTLLNMETCQLDGNRLKPVGRLGGTDFLHATDTFSLRRFRTMSEVEEEKTRLKGLSSVSN